MKSLSVSVRMKANEQQLSCGAVYYAVQGGSISVTIQMKATEQYFPVVLFVML